MAIIEVKDLHKSYQNKEAVKGVSFSVEEGEVFGFIGPNGAGKTTTINMLCTLLTPSKGSAFVNGFSVIDNTHEVRKSIGLVFQEMTLDKELTAYENLKFHCYMYDMDKKLTEKRIDEIFEVVGLQDRRNDLVKEFSGGMKRRLEIGRGLLHRPKILFLDEPTLGLDPHTRINVWDFIHSIRKKENSTVFMTTHYLDEAENCTRIAIIDDGKIISSKTPEEFKNDIKGDTIYLTTEDNEKAIKEIKEKFSIDAKQINKSIMIVVEEGENFIPLLFKELSVTVKSINLKRPTLDDVFINLTGKDIRDK